MIRSLLLAVLPTAAIAGLASAQPLSRAHMEACTEWASHGPHVGTRNDCNRPIAIKFMAADGSHFREADVPPGGWFDSGVSRGAIEGYFFTVCPVGYVPSVPFSLEHAKAISESLYNCLPLGRPDV